MGMFDKDKEIGLLLTSAFAQGQQFVLWHARIDREDFPTKLGPSPRALLTVSQIIDGSAGPRFDVGTLASAIVAKVREAEQDDFPAVVFWREAPSQRSSSGKATVLQFVSAWGNAPEERRPPEVRQPTQDELAARAGGHTFTPAVPPEPGEVTDDDVAPF